LNMRVRRSAIVCRTLAWLSAAVASLGGAASCLPVDTRLPPGSLFLALVSDDEPSIMTADGWSISVDRLFLGIGHASLGEGCTRYSDDDYDRLLDGRLPAAQKVGVLYGLGQCDFQFVIRSPSPNTVLGAGVTEADKMQMGIWDDREPHLHDNSALDFAATATRGGETKHVRWMISQSTSYLDCARQTEGGSRLMRLESSENVTLHVGIRGVELFGNDQSTTAELRFDPFVYADDEFGDGDGNVTLQELARVDVQRLLSFGPFSGLNILHDPFGGFTSLEQYLYFVLLPKIARFRENVTCRTQRGFGSRRPAPPPQ